MNACESVARWWPLVARPRPVCLTLPERIRQVGELIRTTTGASAGDQVTLATRALNNAALIASDCGMHDLARQWCHQHAAAYLLPGVPLAAKRARYALEPLVNLARLLVRAGDDMGAHRLLDNLFRAVANRSGGTAIGGMRLSFEDLTGTTSDHRELCRWLWGVLLADGTRALARAGQWDRALTYAQQVGGVGERLLDGRQVAILAHYHRGDRTTALSLVDNSITPEPWEQAVAACLRALCLTALNRPIDNSALTDHCVRLFEPTPPEAGLLVFRTRIGLTALDLVHDTEAAAERIAGRVIDDALQTRDGYAARDLLTHHQSHERLTKIQRHALTKAVHAAGLDRGTMPAHLLKQLHIAVAGAERLITQNLAATLPASR